MNIAVIRFPGTNNENEAVCALDALDSVKASLVPHFDCERLPEFDAYFLAGGFSYGDYLRPGAVATTETAMEIIERQARTGKKVIGVCNGFQMLTEAGLLPGVLLPNLSTRFICKWIFLKGTLTENRVLRLPIAHFEGRYIVSHDTLNEMNVNGQIALRYTDKHGQPTIPSNPNGSIDNIAGVLNKTGNILGLMPHPERAAFEFLSSTDGHAILRKFLEV